METMEELLKDYDDNLVHKGDILEGQVVSIPDDKTVIVGIKNTEGTLHLDHYTKDKAVTSFKDLLKVGDTVKVKVASIMHKETKEEEHTKILLSCLDLADEKVIAEVKELAEKGENIEVTVTKEIKGAGFNASYKGLNVFMPRSMSTPTVEVGKNCIVKIVKVEETERRINVVVSRHDVESAEYQEKKAAEIETINEGDVLTGKIVKVEKYGAIVKFNYATGLLLAGQVSHKFVDITKELTVGQDIEVKVIKKENGKLDLSRKALIDSPFTAYAKEHKESDTVKGKVANKLAYGLLVELADDVKGLLHSSEYSYNPNDNYASCVKIGDEVEVAIIKMDPDKERISLSRKALMDNPWAKVEAKVGDVTTVKVEEINEKGLKVEAFGVDGFVPASEASSERGNLADLFAVGDTAEAVVLEVRPREWRLKLSIKKVTEAAERKEFEKHMTTAEEAVTIGDTIKK